MNVVISIIHSFCKTFTGSIVIGKDNPNELELPEQDDQPVAMFSMEQDRTESDENDKNDNESDEIMVKMEEPAEDLRTMLDISEVTSIYLQ